MTNAVELMGVTKTFGTLTAVDNLDLVVPRGSVYGFIGPNGSGKTTTLRMVLRILYPDSGRVIVLEFSLPTNPLLRGLYNFYTRQVMPRTATFIARDRSGAYKYLPRSVNTFMDRQAMLGMMTRAGLSDGV